MPWIRLADIDDALALATVHVRAWRAAYVKILPDSFMKSFTIEKRLSEFQRSLSNPLHSIHVVELRDRIVGFVAFGAYRGEEPASHKAAEIWAIYVCPNYWRRGIGSHLLRFAEANLIDEGWAAAFIWVLKENEVACSFYESSGYKPDHARKTMDLGQPVESIRLQKALRRLDIGNDR